MGRSWVDIVAGSEGEYALLCSAPGTPFTLAHRPEIVMEAASTIKLPILIALLRADQEGRLSLRKHIDIKRSHVGRNGSGLLQSMYFNAPFTLYNLAFLMMTVSDNVATNVIIELLGYDEINDYFRNTLGLKRTRLVMPKLDFGPKFSLDQTRMAESTPREMVDLIERLLDGKLLDASHTRTAQRILRRVQKSTFSRRLPPAKLRRFGSKSGWIDGVVEKQEAFIECGYIETKRGQRYVFAVFARQPKDPELPHSDDSSTRTEFAELGRALFDGLEFGTIPSK